MSKELAVVSPWMEDGNVMDYLRENHEANPVKLVRCAKILPRFLADSCPSWKRASSAYNISTGSASFTVAFKG